MQSIFKFPDPLIANYIDALAEKIVVCEFSKIRLFHAVQMVSQVAPEYNLPQRNNLRTCFDIACPGEIWDEILHDQI